MEDLGDKFVVEYFGEGFGDVGLDDFFVGEVGGCVVVSVGDLLEGEVFS